MSQNPYWNDQNRSNSNNGSQTPANAPWTASNHTPNHGGMQPAQWPQQHSAPNRSRTPLWIAIGVLSFFLVVAVVIGSTLAFKAWKSNDSAVDDPYAVDNPDEDQAAEEPAYEESWTVEDIIAATCQAGAWQDGAEAAFPEASSSSMCMHTPDGTRTTIYYAIFSSEFELDNSYATWTNNYPSHVKEPLESGNYLLVMSESKSSLQPLADSYGITIY